MRIRHNCTLMWDDVLFATQWGKQRRYAYGETSYFKSYCDERNFDVISFISKEPTTRYNYTTKSAYRWTAKYCIYCNKIKQNILLMIKRKVPLILTVQLPFSKFTVSLAIFITMQNFTKIDRVVFSQIDRTRRQNKETY